MILPLLWILLRQPIQWNISVDCSRLVQPRFLRILLSCLRLSRIPWTLRRKLRISEAVNLSETIGHVAFVTWLCFVTVLFKWGSRASFRGLSEPVRKELLSQWVYVCIWNATKIKCRLFLLFLDGFVFLSEWTVSALDCNAMAKHSICQQVLGHDSFHGRTE